MDFSNFHTKFMRRGGIIMSLSLYELTDQFLTLEEMALDPEVDPQLIEDSMAALDGDIEFKMENYGKLIRNIEAMTDKVEEKKNRLDARKKTYESRIAALKRNMKSCMQAMGKEKIQTPLFLFYIKQGAESAVIDDVDLVPRDYRAPQPDKIDKAGIKKLLKAGKVLTYAHLERGESQFIMK